MNEKLEFSEKNFMTINHILMQEKGKKSYKSNFFIIDKHMVV